jgi:zinc protease
MGPGRRRPEKKARSWIAVAACLTFQAVVLIAQQSSGPPPWKEKPEKLRLEAGMDCLYQRDLSSPITSVQLFIPGGKSAVPGGKDGLSYLATRLTLEIPDFSVAQDIMAQGTRMGVAVFEDCSVISVECFSENLDDALRVVSEIVQDPLFSGLRIDNIKNVMSIYGKAEEDDAAEAGHGAAMRIFFGGQGYGSALFGNGASLKAIGKKDITAYYARFFTKGQVLFSVCSDLEKDKVRPLLERYFVKFKGARAEDGLSPSPPSLPVDRTIILDRDTKQTYVGRAFLLPPVTAGNWAKGYLLEVLLGKGPGSRLWDLRASGRLAYNVGARMTWMKTCGVLEAYLETEKAKKGQAVSALDENLRTLHEKGLTEEELRMTRSLARAQLLRANEAKRPRAQAMGVWEVLGLGFDYLSNVFDNIDAVSVAEINGFIKDVLDLDKSVLVLVGRTSLP